MKNSQVNIRLSQTCNLQQVSVRLHIIISWTGTSPLKPVLLL